MFNLITTDLFDQLKELVDNNEITNRDEIIKELLN